MAVIRSKRPTSNYTVIANNLIYNKELDWRELGLLVFLLSKPSNWSISCAHLAKEKKTGVDGIRASMKLLQKAGYVTHQRKKSGEVDWYVFDYPQASETPMVDPQPEKPHMAKPHMANPRLISKEVLISKEKENKGFDSFWSDYPNSANKQQAMKAWMRLSIEDKKLAHSNLDSFIAKLPEYQKPVRLHASTYLNNKRWEDTSTQEEVEPRRVWR